MNENFRQLKKYAGIYCGVFGFRIDENEILIYDSSHKEIYTAKKFSPKEDKYGFLALLKKSVPSENVLKSVEIFNKYPLTKYIFTAGKENFKDEKFFPSNKEVQNTKYLINGDVISVFEAINVRITKDKNLIIYTSIFEKFEKAFFEYAFHLKKCKIY